ncbi:MAG: aldo/keto reductase [Clostridia bacterium]|nr:aldo/keto reductase [Clostridia bacterium]
MELKQKLSFGLMRLPLKNKLIQTAVDHAVFCEMADAFLAAGYRHFDTSIVYHGGASETAFRDCVAKRHPRDSFTITDKMPMFLIKHKSMLEPTFKKELARCGVEYFDYYWLHSLNAKSYETCEKVGAFEWLEEKKREGRVLHTGFSFHDSAEVLDRILTKHPEVEYVQLQINYLDWEDEKVQSHLCYETARRHGKRIMIMEPVKGGALADVPETVRLMLEKADPSLSPAVWALRFAASLEGVDFVLSGMSTQSQLEENTAAFEKMAPLTQEQTALLLRAAEVIRSGIEIPCTACRYCVDACPMELAIPDYFSAFNAYQGNKKKAAEDFETHAADHGRPGDCIACRACESHCPQNLPIADLMVRVKERFEG